MPDNAELGAFMGKWAPPLGLFNWKLSAEYVSPREMGDTDDLGEVSYNLLRRKADIKVLHAELAPDVPDFDPEFILIHELLHVVLAPVLAAESDRDRTLAVEHAIDDITETILWAERGNKTAGGDPEDPSTG